MENNHDTGFRGSEESAPYDIDPLFASLLPPLDDVARAALTLAIRTDGKCISPLVVAELPNRPRPVLIDGHQRGGVIDKLREEGVEVRDPEITRLPFPSVEAAVAWVIQHQNARRIWEPWDRAYTLLSNQQAIQALTQRARANEKRGTTLSPTEERVHVDKIVAEAAGVGKNTVHRVRYVMEHAPELAKQMANPQAGTRKSIASAYQEAKADKRRADMEAMQSKPQPPAPEDDGGWENRIVVGDAREALKRIPDGAATIYVCSPPYTIPDHLIGYDVYRYPGLEKWVEEFTGVMREAFRTLRDGGRVVVNIDAANDRSQEGSTKIDIHYWVSKVMYEIGFGFLDEVCWFKQNNSGDRPSWGTYLSPRKPNIRRQHEYLLVYYKGTPFLDGDEEKNDILKEEFHQATMSTWGFDAGKKQASDVGSFWYVKAESRKVNHPAPYSVKLVDIVLKVFSRRGDLVVDPYNGSGTTCLAAMLSGRRYYGCDVSAAYCVAARERLTKAAAEQQGGHG